jgi:hypothetical protein
MVAMVIGGSTHPAAGCVQDEATLREALNPQVAGGRRTDLPPLFQLRARDYEHGQPQLLVGIHGDRGVLWWSHPDADESLLGVSPDGLNREEVMYRLDTDELDFPPRAELSLLAVLDAAAEFLCTGERPTTVNWVSDDDAWALTTPEHVRHAS